MDIRDTPQRIRDTARRTFVHIICSRTSQEQFAHTAFSCAHNKRARVWGQYWCAQCLHVCALGGLVTVTVHSGCSRLLIVVVMRPGGRPEQLGNIIWEQLGAVEEQSNS